MSEHEDDEDFKPVKTVRQCAKCGKLRSQIDPNSECTSGFTRHIMVDAEVE